MNPSKKKLLPLFFCFILVACSNSKLEPVSEPYPLPEESFDEPGLTLSPDDEPSTPSLSPSRKPVISSESSDPSLPPSQQPSHIQEPSPASHQFDCPCTQSSLSPYQHQQAEVRQTEPYTKVLFIVDKSKWQNDKYDRGAEIRMSYIRQYYETQKQNGWLWGMIAFSDKHNYPFKGSRVWPLIFNHENEDHPAFVDDDQKIHRAINDIGLRTDVGKDVGTGYSYQEPLKLAKEIIKRDIRRSSGANYHIIFMASGVPLGDHHNDGQEGGLEWRIFERIDDILKLSPDRVSLSTVYYGENRDPATRHTRSDGSLNPNAYNTRSVEPYNVRTVLQAMARRGHGFYDEVLTSSGFINNNQQPSYNQSPCDCRTSYPEAGYHPSENFSQSDYSLPTYVR